MEEQPWIWNDFKLAGAARKFHSILDDEDNDNIVAISDRAAVPRAWKKKGKPNIFATASNFRENQQQEPEEKQQQQQQRGSPSGSVDSPNDDYVYEDRPLMNPLMADESGQYYGKLTTDIVKRSQLPSFNPLNGGKRRQKQQQQQRNSMTPQQTLSSSSSSSTGVDDSIASQEQQSSLSAIGRDSAEPRVLPLLGFHSAVNKINRQKESFLKKILRQAGRFIYRIFFFCFFVLFMATHFYRQFYNSFVFFSLSLYIARRQSMKRSPNCMRKCIAQGLLHPAQCHSLC